MHIKNSLICSAIMALFLVVVLPAHAAAADKSPVVDPLTVEPAVWIGQQVTASDGMQDDSFGQSVALYGDTAVMGAPSAGTAGAAYVFHDVNGTWKQVQELVPSDGTPSAGFGYAVAIHDHTIVVGAPAQAVGNGAAMGAVYVYTLSDDVWTQTQELSVDEASFLGFSVAMSGNDYFVAGAPASNVYVGAAFIFTNSGGVWSESAELEGDTAYHELFGDSVASSDHEVIVGAPCAVTLGNAGGLCPNRGGAGRAYVFAETSGSWNQVAKLSPEDGGEAGDAFGHAVAIAGPNILIGAARIPGSHPEGEVYAFSHASGSWVQTQQITTSHPKLGLGEGIALFGHYALIGAPCYHIANRLFDPTLCVGAGDGLSSAAYLYDHSSGSWVLRKTFVSPYLVSQGVDPHDNSFFGNSVALDGTSVLVGAKSARLNGVREGAANFYSESDLAVSVSAPKTVKRNSNYVSQTTVTNASTSVTPAAIAVTMTVPASASLVSATATPGSCSHALGTVACNLDQIAGNAGVATVDLTLKAVGRVGDVIVSTAHVKNASPELTASAPTRIRGNAAPVASDGTLTTDENSAADGTLHASDADGDPLTFSIVDGPGHGRVKIVDASSGAYTYTPDQDYTGDDGFTFQASDGQADSKAATIAITVKSVNTPPVASAGTLTTDENSAADGTLHASDADGDPLTFSIVNGPSHGSVKIVDASSGAYTYTPDQDYTGDDGFTFQASDGQAASAPAAVTITVQPVHTAPPPPPASSPTKGGGGGGAASPLMIILLTLLGLLVMGRKYGPMKSLSRN